MQNRLPIALGLIVALLFLAAACSKENAIPIEERVKVVRSLLGCSAYEAHEIAMRGDNASFYNRMVQHGQYFLYGGASKLLITEDFGGKVIRQESDYVGSFFFHRFQSRLFVYGGIAGVYEFFSDGRLELISGQRVITLANTPDGKLIGAGSSTIAILEFDPVNFSSTPYIGNYPLGESMCRDIVNLHFSPDGYLWATDCDMNLLQFDGTSFVGWFNAQNTDFWGERGWNPPQRETFFRNHGNSMIILTKGTPGYYKVLRYEDGAWSDVFLIDNLDANPAERLPEKGLEMLRGTAYDMEIVGDKLFICTHRNIQEIDLSKGDGQTYEGALTIADPNLAFESCYDLYQSPAGEWYILNNQKNAVRLGCN
jgi:hypothetical protein